MHTQRRYATCPKGMSKNKKEKKMHTQRRYDTCPQGMSKEKKGKDSPHPRKIKKRDGSCKGVHPPSAKKKSTHLHILIKVYDLFLLWIRFLT